MSLSLDIIVHDEETNVKFKKKIKANKGDSVLDILTREEDLNAKFEQKRLSRGECSYVTEILGIHEERGFCWEYKMNGEFPDCSVNDYHLTGKEKTIEMIRTNKYIQF